MAKRMLKLRVVIAAVGALYGGCCLCGLPKPCDIVTDLVFDGVWEFVYDNDAVFDLFEDDFGTGILYDDRNTVAPTRAEP